MTLTGKLREQLGQLSAGGDALLRPTDESTRQICRKLSDLKLLRPQACFDGKKLCVSYAITAAGWREIRLGSAKGTPCK
jgi:hypothetical protein